jgi:hypothetical protein
MPVLCQVICNKIHGRTQHRILAFLMSLRVVERPIWLVRAGPIECDDPDVPGPLPAAAGDSAAPSSPPGTGGTAGGPASVSRRRYSSDLALEPPYSEAEAAEAEAEAGGQKAPGDGPQKEAEAAEAADQDDCWASLHGRASWQREPAARAGGVLAAAGAEGLDVLVAHRARAPRRLLRARPRAAPAAAVGARRGPQRPGLLPRPPHGPPHRRRHFQ